MFVVQLGTAWESTFDFLRKLGADPLAYSAGLTDRVRKLAPDAVTAATNLVGIETVEVALALGVPPERISTIAVGSKPPDGVRETGGIEARPDVLERITDGISPAKSPRLSPRPCPIEQIRQQ